MVAGHRDADDKNTLITEDGRLLLIDWDAAGPVDPAHELTSVLIDWSGAPAGEGRTEVVRAILEAYSANSDTLLPLDPSGWISAQLGWLHFNLQRALGDFEAEDAELGQREVTNFLERAREIDRGIDSWLESWRPA